MNSKSCWVKDNVFTRLNNEFAVVQLTFNIINNVRFLMRAKQDKYRTKLKHYKLQNLILKLTRIFIEIVHRQI